MAVFRGDYNIIQPVVLVRPQKHAVRDIKLGHKQMVWNAGILEYWARW